MKIVIFAVYYLPHVGGYCKNIYELSKRLVAKGHEVHIVTCDTENQGHGIQDGIDIVRLPSWNILNGNFPIPKLSKDLIYLFTNYHGKSFDVVITQTRFFTTSFLGLLFAKRFGIPLIHVERGSIHTVMESKILTKLSELYDHTIGSMIVKSARLNIGVSQAACDFIKHLGGKNIKLIYNGIEVFNEDNQARNDICFVGRLIFSKGVQDLIEAFNNCCQQQEKNLRLIIVGDGDYRETLMAQADNSPYSKQILFYGTKSHKDVINILAKSDFFVNPSYSEGLPTSVMEAASLGLPIIATDVGGTKEIITHGESGLIYQPHDINELTGHMLWLLKDSARARKLGYESLRVMKHKFDWDDIVGEYENVFKGLV